jgi:hypothetical protein
VPLGSGEFIRRVLVIHCRAMDTATSSNACPICNETRVHHERVYAITGCRVLLKFSDCLHTLEEMIAASRDTNGAGPTKPDAASRYGR